MKNNTTSKIQESTKRLHQFLSNKIKIPWYFVLLLLCTSTVEAQDSVLFLTWDTEVGCVDGSNNPRDGKDYLEYIEDGVCLRVCQGATVTYTLHGYETSWQNVVWDIAGGALINLSSDKTICTVQWSNGTVGTIGATIVTSNNTRILPELCIELIKKPIARFWKAPFNYATDGQLDLSAGINVCANEVFTFENISIPNNGTPIVDYYWDFGDGTTSTEFEPSHVYTDSGSTYWVTLTVTNQCNCKSTTKIKVNVGKKSVNIICPAVVCEGQSATYTLSEIGYIACQPYNWSVEGGVITSQQPYNSSIDILWTPSGVTNNTVGGFGYVTFDPSGCGLDCYVPTNLKIPVITDNMAFVGPNSVCGNSQNRFTMPQWPTTDFVWEVINEGGTNASVIYTDQRNEIILNPGTVAGVITLRVTYQNTLLNCGGTSERKINIKKDATITGPRETCIGTEVQYYLEEEETVNWTLKLLPNGPSTQGTGSSLTTIFTTAGNYSLSISGTTICNGEAVIIKVRSPQTPLDSDITDTDGVPNARIVCPSAPSTFSNTNQIPGTIIGWSIPPGVGTIVGSSYGDTIQVIFNYPTVPAGQPYTLNVWRETTTNPACKSPELTINLAPEVLDLTIVGEPFPCGSTRHNYALPVGIVADTFEWSIDPMDAGSISTNGGTSISVLWNQFSGPKNAVIKVKATKCNIPQNSADFNQDFEVLIDNPRITIVDPIGPFCPGDNVPFSITPSVPLTVSPANIIWEFGDGRPEENGASVNHVYTNSGTYTVRVRVIQPNGCFITLTQTTTVTISPLPTAIISPSRYTVCSGNPINVTLTTVLGIGVTSYLWYKTGNSASIGSTASITVTDYGDYYVEISNGTCTNKVYASVVDCSTPCITSPIPQLTLNLTPSCTTIAAVGTYIPSSSPAPTGYQWDSNFINDDVLPGSSYTNATFSFEEPGNHTIRYGIAYNNQLCYTWTQATVLIPYIAKVGTAISCGTNSYNITLTDLSLVDPSVTSLIYTFEIDNVIIQQGANPANSRFEPISGGTHTIRLTISGGGHPACTIEKTITLPAFPNAAFSVPSTVCQENSALFTVVNHVLGQEYWWDFGDATYNYQQNPEKEYELVDFYDAVLYITNAYCRVSSPGSIEVLANKQNGLIATPLIGCPGGSTSLSFSSSGNPTSTTYQWLLNNQPIPGATTNPYSVSQTGSYSIIVGAPNLCTKRISQSVAVAIPNPPFASIQGPSNACEYQPFALFVKAGAAATGIQYEWRIQGGPLVWSTDSFLEISGLTVGTYTFILNIITTLATGGVCTSELTHTVTVYALPEVTALGSITNCEPFEVTLTAQANESDGVYNWSTGVSGQQISDTNGGAFQVTYTSETGCKNSFDLTVPNNPDNYMWIFPYGCYTFCGEFNTGTLIGPSIAYFDKWDWLKNDGSDLSGGFPDQVQPYDIASQDATYNLQLETKDCKIKSKDMIVDIIDCNCEIGAEIRDIKQLSEPFNHYEVILFIDNPSSIARQVLVTLPNEVGVMTPSSVSVPYLGGLFTFLLLPDTGFNGGTYSIKLNTTNGEGQLCETELETYLPPFESIESLQNGNGEGNSTAFKLTLVPNPANSQTQLHYDFGSTPRLNTQTIEVYDIYGRQLELFVPQQKAASWDLNTSAYETGIYIIVMKQDGKIVQQKNLIITH